MPCLSDMINDHKNPINLRVHSRYEVINCETQFVEWKIQLTQLQLILFLLNILKKLVRTMHTKSNIEIKMDSKTDDIINKLFEFFFLRRGRMRGSAFIFDGVICCIIIFREQV